MISSSVSRRDFLRIGGLGLCGVGMLDVLQAQLARASQRPEAKAKSMIVCWLGGGPPHLDMFDMKPDAPEEYRGEFKPIKTNVPGLDVCELMPELAKRADKYTVIRSVSTLNKPGDHSQAPLYWLTGNPRLASGSDEYPMIGSVVSKLRPGPADLPSFATLGIIDVHTINQLASSFLGPAHAPFIFDPLKKEGDDTSKMLVPQMELPSFQRNADLLKAVDGRLRRLDRLDPLVEGLDQYQQTAFNLLRSPKLRHALDLTKEDPKRVERYGQMPAKTKYPSGNVQHMLLARRLVEAGVPIVHFNLGYWDWHGENFVAGRQQIPAFDRGLSALLDDLDERGLLDTTIVLALGEMGRMPKCGTKQGAGRDHWDYAQFVLAAGGGFKRGCVVGSTDKLGERVKDNFYKVESFGSTLYHLLGIDPHAIVTTPANRPIKLIAEEAPIIKEAIG